MKLVSILAALVLASNFAFADHHEGTAAPEEMATSTETKMDDMKKAKSAKASKAKEAKAKKKSSR